VPRDTFPVALNRGIRGFRRPRGEIERSIAAAADAQLGLIATEQLLALGLSQDAIERRVVSGRLVPIYRGVFAVGRVRLGNRARWKAATHAVGRGAALLAHLCAGGLWDVWPEPEGQPHVVLPGNGRHNRPARHADGIVVHRMRRMEPSDRGEVDGIPVTSLELTCLHLASVLSRRSFERVVLRAARRPEFRIDEAVALAARSRGRPGISEFRTVVERDLTAELHSLSELESRLVQIVRHHGLPLPEINRDVEALMVDAVWHDARAIVELDGFAFHRLPRDLRNDNARTRKLVLAGYRVIRFVWDDVVGDPAGVADAIRRLIEPGRS
jgi:very-short-patch-repair endonuclease